MIQVALIYHEVFLRTLRIAHLLRAEFIRDEDGLVVPYSKKFYQVALIDHLQEQISTNLVFRNISFLGSMKLKTTRPMAPSQ